jgi:hypothetical protein
MAFKESHDCYRSKETLVNDVAVVLNAPLSVGTKRSVLHSAIWNWTEFDGKYNPRHWSVEAKKREIEIFRKETRRRDKPGIHEHAVPRIILFRLFLELAPATPENVLDLFKRLVHGVILTREEDKLLNANGFRQKMPREFSTAGHPDYQNPWLRYKACGIVLNPTPENW